VSELIAKAVAEVAWDTDLAGTARQDDLPAAVRALMWDPQYPDLLGG